MLVRNESEQQVGRWGWGTVAAGGWRIGYGDVYRKVGDFDGDGNADILVSSPWGIGVLGVGADGSLVTKAIAPYGASIGGFTLSSSRSAAGPCSFPRRAGSRRRAPRTPSEERVGRHGNAPGSWPIRPGIRRRRRRRRAR